jgi:hypothetical protein
MILVNNMRAVKRVAYVIGLVFASGLLGAFVNPNDATHFEAFLRTNPLVAASIVGFCGLASGTTAYVAAYAVRRQPRWRFLLRLFYFALPAVAGGIVLSTILVWLDLFKLPDRTIFVGLLSASYLAASLAGLAAMRSIPEYRHVFLGMVVPSQIAHTTDVAENK